MNNANLIPELAQWNDGAGVSPDEWIFIEGRADHSLALCAMIWPEFAEFEGYVLRRPLNVEQLRDWQKTHEKSRQQIETAMNAYLLEGIFPQDQTNMPLKKAQCERLARVMADMVAAKLVRDFPERRFSVFVMHGEDVGVSFHQL